MDTNWTAGGAPVPPTRIPISPVSRAPRIIPIRQARKTALPNRLGVYLSRASGCLNRYALEGYDLGRDGRHHLNTAFNELLAVDSELAGVVDIGCESAVRMGWLSPEERGEIHCHVSEAGKSILQAESCKRAGRWGLDLPELYRLLLDSCGHATAALELMKGAVE